MLPHACEHSCTHTFTLVNTLAHTHVNLRSAHLPAGVPSCPGPRVLLEEVLIPAPPGGRQQHPGAPGRAEWGRQGQPVLGPRAAQCLPLFREGLGSGGWFQTQTGPLCAQTGAPMCLSRWDTPGPSACRRPVRDSRVSDHSPVTPRRRPRGHGSRWWGRRPRDSLMSPTGRTGLSLGPERDGSAVWRENDPREACHIFSRRMLEVLVARYGKRNLWTLKSFTAGGAEAFTQAQLAGARRSQSPACDKGRLCPPASARHPEQRENTHQCAFDSRAFLTGSESTTTLSRM